MANLSSTSAGLSSDPGLPDDLQVIYQGGEHFLDRMKALNAKQLAAAQALADLKLGQDVAAAQKAAQEALAEADSRLAEADHILASAKAEAAKTLAEAEAAAHAAVEIANEAATQTDATAATVKKEADDYATETKAKADEVMAAANQRMTDVTTKSVELEVAKKTADDTQAKANESWIAARASKAEHDDRIAQIAAIISPLKT